MKSAACPEDVPLPIRRPGLTRARGKKCRPGLVYKMRRRRCKDPRVTQPFHAIPCHSFRSYMILYDLTLNLTWFWLILHPLTFTHEFTVDVAECSSTITGAYAPGISPSVPVPRWELRKESGCPRGNFMALQLRGWGMFSNFSNSLLSFEATWTILNQNHLEIDGNCTN